MYYDLHGVIEEIVFDWCTNNKKVQKSEAGKDCTKYCGFLRKWASRARNQHYVLKEWQLHENIVLGLKAWFQSDRLLLNKEKSQSMIFTLKKFENNTYQQHNTFLETQSYPGTCDTFDTFIKNTITQYMDRTTNSANMLIQQSNSLTRTPPQHYRFLRDWLLDQ